MDSGEQSFKKHKKHKKEKDKSEGYGGSPLGVSGTPGIKLILKVGGSSTPEHSDSPGPSGAMNFKSQQPCDGEDSEHSSLFAQYIKKSKKKDKKRKKDKKHKHHHKDRKRVKETKKEDVSHEPINSEQNIAKVEHGHKSRSVSMEREDVQFSLHSLSNVREHKPVPPKTSKCMDKQPFQKLLDYLIRTLETKDTHQFFAWPVTDKIAPGYSSIIKKPMDFSTMKSKIENESYSSLSDFTEDFKLMCNNAMTYNQPETIYWKSAKKLLQSGLKILSADKIKSLLPLIPSIRLLTEEHLGSSLFETCPQECGEVSHSEDDMLDLVCLDPTKSIHYMPPHPNDPPDMCGAFADDLTTEEVLLQVRLAAREAARRLAAKKTNPKMGFLRQKQDGSTSLAIITPASGNIPGRKELPVSLGALSGKLTHSATQVLSHKEDKRSLQRAKPICSGTLSSCAPTHDSTFANLNQEETEMVETTYGNNETSVQYAESMIEFAKGCDYAMHMVDEILDTITKGEHRKTVTVIEERKRKEAEETRRRMQEEELSAQLETEWQDATHTAQTVNLDALRSLGDIGIDTQFLNDFQQGGSVTGVQ